MASRSTENGTRAASPYADLPARAYWRSGVGDRSPLDPGDLYRPRFPIDRSMKVVTARSCFAQHVGRALRTNGFAIVDAEPLPPFVPEAVAQRFGYRLYSARYGNIYTARQLLQLLLEARGGQQPALPVWRRGDRFFDAQRPSVEPDGLDSPDSVLRHRQAHLAQVNRAFGRADLFVFTFGLTEAWIHTETGTVYPTAPGTIAGEHDPATFSFKNYDVAEVLADFRAFRQRMKRLRPELKFLVTVSPVPLTATASGQHVEVATSYSKSVLRAVCGMLVEEFEDVDYFPSYELITSQNARGVYYEDNKRNVSAKGVETAMGLFMRAHGVAPGEGAAQAPASRRPGPRAEASGEDVVCEEILLEAFAK